MCSLSLSRGNISGIRAGSWKEAVHPRGVCPMWAVGGVVVGLREVMISLRLLVASLI